MKELYFYENTVDTVTVTYKAKNFFTRKRKIKKKTFNFNHYMDSVIYYCNTNAIKWLGVSATGESEKEVTQKVNEKIEKMMENFKKDNPHLLSVDYTLCNWKIKKASEQKAEWCFQHFTIPQLAELGLTIVNGEDL